MSICTYIVASYKNKVALPARARMSNTSSHRLTMRSRAKVSREEVHKFFEHFQEGV